MRLQTASGKLLATDKLDFEGENNADQQRRMA